MPKRTNRKQYTTSIDTELIDKLKIYCAINKIYQNEVLEKLIGDLLKTREKIDIKTTEETKRKMYTTTIDTELIDEFKIYCAINKQYQNEVLETLLRKLFEKEGGEFGNTN